MFLIPLLCIHGGAQINISLSRIRDTTLMHRCLARNLRAWLVVELKEFLRWGSCEYVPGGKTTILFTTYPNSSFFTHHHFPLFLPPLRVFLFIYL